MSPCGTWKWTSAIGTRQFTIAFSLPKIVIKPDRLTRFYGDRPPVLPCPQTRITKLAVWTHNSIWYPKMDIRPCTTAIHYGVQLAQYCDQTRSLNAISRRSPPCVLPCPKTLEHQRTCVDSWVHRVAENGHQPLGRGNSLWHSACPILWSIPIS